MWTRWKLSGCSLVVAGVALLGCKGSESASKGLDASDPGNAGPDAGQPDASPPNTTLTLPITISDYFVPGGYMGDGELSPSAITVQTSPCRQPRPPAVSGDCYLFTYHPGSRAWAGVYWQYPEKNWGTNPGKQIEAGASKVTFYAAGATGHEVLLFVAGGENDAHLPYHDSFTAMTSIALTTTLTQYEINIANRTYESGVLGAFAWSVGVTPGTTSPVEFYLDAIRWEK